MHCPHLFVRIAAVIIAVVGCASSSSRPAQVREYPAFGNPRRVTIRGYQGDAMEPFMTRDGRYLFFNNLNDPAVDTNLHYAERLDALTFEYGGEIQGANTNALEGVPSMDTAGTFYFVSTRSYQQTLSTIYRGHFFGGILTGVEVLPGISKLQPGAVNFDVEVSPDGGTLYFVDGIFRGGPVPQAADLAIAIRHGARFQRLDQSTELLQHVNTSDLEYAAAVSTDGLELFFTRLRGQQTGIYRTTRPALDAAFEPPARVRAIEGFVEAPTLAPDGRSLYYHKREGSRFGIFRVSRP
jgi:hypothetical protein